ncbi:hypothetical protein WR25_10316 isoform A [Diploscapter pachys]|uniref:Globin domain-containing protein n=1 Tax=Diploscapter pachys TaxID=2018661 RepID=A0A2A2KYP5_9BILA|nr:hypothetical protein WR25_10316 isoform A [Diploscapter pachys]
MLSFAFGRQFSPLSKMFSSRNRPGNLSPYYITSAPDSPTSPSMGRSASQYSKNKPHRPLAERHSASSSHLQPRALRRCRSASPAPPPGSPQSPHSGSHHHGRETELSAEKKILLRKSWQKIPKSTFGETVMSNLVQKIGSNAFGPDPTSIERHRRQVTDLIQTCIDNLDDLESAIKSSIENLTRGHSGLHIKSRHWEAFGEILQSCLFEWIGPGRTHKETVKAWMILISFLSDRLIVAARHAESHHNSPVPSPSPRSIHPNYILYGENS